MFGLVARLLGGAVSPLVDRAAAAGAALARKVALFVVAAACFLVVVASLTVAFDLWITSLAGAIVGALAVAGLYLAVGIVAVVLALRPTGAARPAEDVAAEQAAQSAQAERGSRVDAFAAPILDFMARLGLRREQMAVLAGASLAKQLKPVPLVGIAIVAGFLIGRLWKGWGGLLSADLITTIMGLFATTQTATSEPAASEPTG